MNEKIALLVDSGMDLPPEILKQAGVYVVPLNIIYSEGVYIDKVTITSEEIYERLPREVPSTSLPDGEAIATIFEKIIAEEYTHLIIVTISSGLSGTHNMLKLMSGDYPQITTQAVDTKSIGIGGGLQGAYAKELIDQRRPYNEIVKTLQENVEESRVFFSIPTLEYLKKGGRIGLVSSIVGTALNLNPVISCNREGIYYTVTKARGRKKSIEKMVQQVESFLDSHTPYDLGVAYGNSLSDANELADALKLRFKNIKNLYIDEVSPALGVHTGPGVIGIGVLKR